MLKNAYLIPKRPGTRLAYSFCIQEVIMKKLTSYLCILILAVLTTKSFADADDAKDTVIRESKEAVDASKAAFFDMVNKNNVNVEFDKGNATLTEGEKRDIKAIVDSLDRNTKDLTVVIAAWSDKSYPIEKNNSLNNSDVVLAKKRADNIRQYVKQLSDFK